MYQGKKIGCIIAAAGLGKRMGGSVPKTFLPLGEKTVLETTVDAFVATGFFDCIVVVTHPDYVIECRNTMAEGVRVCPGGEERQESVFLGLTELARLQPETELVLIHDGARPFVSGEVIARVLGDASRSGAALAAVPVTDTIKQANPAGISTLPRDSLYQAQTPQGFSMELIFNAHQAAALEGFTGTDDSQLVERLGRKVTLTEGDYANIKITTPGDFKVGETTRAGTGFDVHRLTTGRPLVLGGVTIPFEKGLLGHSDADVLTHAVLDALLGAAGLGDIGGMFPDTDGKYLGISSMILLKQVGDEIRKAGFEIGNIDGTIIAQRPRMAPYREEMIKNMAAALDIPGSKINLKATTTEKLGIPGREEGMAAEAVCTLLQTKTL